jgi:cytochrome c biogenesis protein CcdA
VAERLSGASATLLDSIASVLPVGYAFTAGMVAAVNPCGFALLPAYLGLYLGGAGPRGWAAVPRALTVSGVVTLSFVLLFGAAGVVVSAATSAVAAYFPWLGLVVGVALVVVAGRLIAGHAIYGDLGDRLADRMGSAARQGGPLGYAAFGLAYAVASLGCTLPVFLVVVGSAMVLHGLLVAVLEFALYGLGMGAVMAALTLALALIQRSALAPVRRASRFVHPASAVLLLVTGGYVVYYWLTVGGLLDRL